MNGITLTFKLGIPKFIVFTYSILRFIRPSANNVYNYQNREGIKLLTRLRTNLSPLRSHRFRYSFQDVLNPPCTCALHEESTSHFLLYCPSFDTRRFAFLSKIREVDSNLLNCTDSVLTHTVLFGKSSFNIITTT